MKIAHIGDIHWGLGYPGPTPQSRFEDICRTMDWAADRIIGEECDLVLIAGDMFKDARVFLDRASLEIKAAVDWLRKFSEADIATIVISGTPSHDAIAAYELIKEMRLPIPIMTEPDFIPMWINDGPINIACLPGMNRSSLVAQEEYRNLPPHQIHQIMTDKITQICHGLLSRCKEEAGSAVNILLSHLTYDLSDKGFEDVLMQHEPALTQEAVNGFDLVCLGHIHRPQQNGNVFYCGSPERLNFNDEKITPGFWIHEINLDLAYDNINSLFIETPARHFYTAQWKERDVDRYLQGNGLSGFVFKDAIVRLHYSCSEELAKLLDRKALERSLYKAEAFFVSEIKADVQRLDRARDQEVTESMGPVEALTKWAEQQGVVTDETIALQSMTANLLEEVAA